MRLNYSPEGASSSLAVVAPFFLLVLMVIGFTGCASLERVPHETESFLIERALHTRQSAGAALEEGDYLAAVSKYREAYDLEKRIGNDSGRILDLVGMGRAYTGLGRTEVAVSVLTDAVRQAFKSRDDRGLSMAYSALARAYLMTGNLDLAVKNIEDALTLERSGGGADLNTLNLAGVIYLEAGRLDEAASLANTAIDAQDQSPPSSSLSESYRVMAGILVRKEDLPLAMVYFNMAYSVDEKLGDNEALALDLGGSADALLGAGKFEKAASRLKKSYVLNREAGLLERALGNLDKLVEVYVAMGDKKNELYFRTMREAVLSDMR